MSFPWEKAQPTVQGKKTTKTALVCVCISPHSTYPVVLISQLGSTLGLPSISGPDPSLSRSVSTASASTTKSILDPSTSSPSVTVKSAYVGFSLVAWNQSWTCSTRVIQSDKQWTPRVAEESHLRPPSNFHTFQLLLDSQLGCTQIVGTVHSLPVVSPAVAAKPGFIQDFYSKIPQLIPNIFQPLRLFHTDNLKMFELTVTHNTDTVLFQRWSVCWPLLWHSQTFPDLAQ